MASFKDIKRFTPMPNYRVTMGWDYMEKWIEEQQKWGMDMNPEFQRAHVWSEEQQRRYVEYILKGGASGREVYWNQEGWMDGFTGMMCLVDGKQRIEAVRRFMNNEFGIFAATDNPSGNIRSSYERIMPLDASFNWNINTLKTYKEVMRWYIDLNDGGIAHTSEEIEKVRELLKKEK